MSPGTGEARIASLETQVGVVVAGQANLAAAMAELRSMSSAQVAELRATMTAQVEALRQSMKEDRDQILGKIDSKVDKLRDDVGSTVRNLKQEVDRDISEQKAELKGVIVGVQDTVDEDLKAFVRMEAFEPVRNVVFGMVGTMLLAILTAWLLYIQSGGQGGQP